jgi:hypothetical protein
VPGKGAPGRVERQQPAGKDQCVDVAHGPFGCLRRWRATIADGHTSTDAPGAFRGPRLC